MLKTYNEDPFPIAAAQQYDAINMIFKALDAVGPDPVQGWARIVVTDNGVGIPAEKIEDVFKPFVSTKGSKGTGLGLAVSRKILREHGGDILVTSKPNRGSKFVLRLPMKSPLDMDVKSTLEIHLDPPEAN